MERHVAFVTVAEVGNRILGPLIGFCEKHAISKPRINLLPKVLEKFVCFGKVLAIGALALV